MIYKEKHHDEEVFINIYLNFIRLGYIYDNTFATEVVKALKPYLGKTC